MQDKTVAPPCGATATNPHSVRVFHEKRWHHFFAGRTTLRTTFLKVLLFIALKPLSGGTKSGTTPNYSAKEVYNGNRKNRVSAYLSDEDTKKLDAIVNLLNLSPTLGRSSAIEKAIDFYFSF